MEKYAELQNLIESLKRDMDKFHNRNNKTAGIRLRRALQDVKALSQEMRLEISEKRKIIDKYKKK